MDYKKAGVDIEAGENLVHWLKQEQPKKWPHQERLVSGIGGFASLFRANFPEMKSPCLVSATDGVGTKLKLAVEYQGEASVAQDLVAMCVNDLICTGASPLFFLDYYATGKLELDAAKRFLSGLQQACLEADSLLIGGETAEMPGVYHGKDFDCAGFAVGIVDEEKVLGAQRVQVGDRLVGVESSGFHSNGYSLLRKVFEKDLDQWSDELLKPTRLYVKFLKQVISSSVDLHALAHITGGGMDNLVRVMPKGTMAELQAWKLPAPFQEVKERTQMSWEQLLKTLNCGIGLVLIVKAGDQSELINMIEQNQWKAYDLGEVKSNEDVEASPFWTIPDSFKEMQK